MVRPVVVLSSNTKLTKVGDTWEIAAVGLDKKEINAEIASGSTATETLTATLINATGDLTWTSSDTSVAEISGSGNTRTITLKAGGTATITVTCGELSTKCSVTVTEK